MSGHSKWANIKHRKGKQDIARGKIFTKLIREITVAARSGEDVNANSKLRLAVDKALSQNMSRDTIDRAIKRGAGGEGATAMEEITYEGYAAGGVALLVECLTDNRNRTAGEVRHAFSKHGGNMGSEGSVVYLFKTRGVIYFAPGVDEEKIATVAIENCAEDLTINDDGSIEVYTTKEDFLAVKAAFEKDGLLPESAEVTKLATTEVALDRETSLKVVGLIEALEELDDVQNVYSNADFASEVFEQR